MPEISTARRIWLLLERPHTEPEIDAHFGRRIGHSLRSARSNGYVAKPPGRHWVRGPNVPSEDPPQPGRKAQPKVVTEYEPMPLETAWRRVPVSVFDLGRVL